jgi:GH24 family phage-related lysozyme (muramidase)
VQKNKKYSLDECASRLNADMFAAVQAVERCVPDLPVNVLAAFSDAVYNMGPRIACDLVNSTAARLLKAKSITLACEQLPRWNKAKVLGVMVELPGLTKRRAAERALCLEQ